jgi:hypothetical protein
MRQGTLDARDSVDSLKFDELSQSPTKARPSEVNAPGLSSELVALDKLSEQHSGLGLTKINQRGDGADAHVKRIRRARDLG